MAGQIFISYRRDGGDAMAYLLWERLLSHGYKVFFDVDSLGAGKFDARILKDIEKSSHVLLVLSPNALDRSQDKDDWVRKEIVHAVKCDKTIIPIILRGFKWPERFPKGMEGLDRYNGIEMTDLRHFTEDLDRLEELFIGKVSITDDGETLRFQADAYEPSYGHFRDSIGCYLGVIHETQKRLHDVYDEMVRQKESQKELASYGFRSDESLTGENKVLS